MPTPSLLVTGGAGFIGSHFVRLLAQLGHRVTVIDALTYAGHRINLDGVEGVTFLHGDVTDGDFLARAFAAHPPEAIFHFAAESHVDQSIDRPGNVLHTNITGTYHLLEAARRHWAALPADAAARFRYVQISTDEVFGALGATGHFSETSPYAPNSPYAASKAAADHLVHAWHHTYGLPTLITHCSNNYGARQLPEKFIPVCITRALAGEPLPLYGDGDQVRDWIHASDHCQGIWLAYQRGQVGEHYCFGGREERTNKAVAEAVCALLGELRPRANDQGYHAQIRHVADRPGHDRRYAVNDDKARTTLGFATTRRFEDGLRETVMWYLAHPAWREAVMRAYSL